VLTVAAVIYTVTFRRPVGGARYVIRVAADDALDAQARAEARLLVSLNGDAEALDEWVCDSMDPE
jgi:hypothetical protein